MLERALTQEKLQHKKSISKYEASHGKGKRCQSKALRPVGLMDCMVFENLMDSLMDLLC